MERWRKLGKCEIVDSWSVRVLRRAAGCYNRLARSGHAKWARGKHQGFVILATAELYNAAILTADSDFPILVERMGSSTPLYFVEISKDGEFHIKKKNIESIPCLDEILDICKEKCRKILSPASPQ